MWVFADWEFWRGVLGGILVFCETKLVGLVFKIYVLPRGCVWDRLRSRIGCSGGAKP